MIHLRVVLWLSFLALTGCFSGKSQFVGEEGAAVKFSPDESLEPSSLVTPLDSMQILDSLGVGGVVNAANWNDQTKWNTSIDLMTRMHVKRVRMDLPNVYNGNSYLIAKLLLQAGIEIMFTTHLRMEMGDQKDLANSAYACHETFDPLGKLLTQTGDCYTDQLGAFTVTTTSGTWTYMGAKGVIDKLDSEIVGAKGKICIEGPNEWALETHNSDPLAHVKLNNYLKMLDSGLAGYCVVAPTVDPNFEAAFPPDYLTTVSWADKWNWFKYIPSYRFFDVANNPLRFANTHNYTTPKYFDWSVPSPDPANDVERAYTAYHTSLFHHQVWQTAPAKMVVSEYGISTCPTCLYSESDKAKLLPLRWIQFAALGYRRTFIYQFVDRGMSASDSEDFYGIIDKNLVPKPTYFAFKRLAGWLYGVGVPSLEPISFKASNSSAADPNEGFGSIVTSRGDGKRVVVLYRKPTQSSDVGRPLSIYVQVQKNIQISAYTIDQDASIGAGIGELTVPLNAVTILIF